MCLRQQPTVLKYLAMSAYKQIFYQIIFSAKNREAALADEHCEELYKFIWGIINKKKL